MNNEIMEMDGGPGCSQRGHLGATQPGYKVPERDRAFRGRLWP